VQGTITVRNVHSLAMIILPHQAPRVFIVPQIRRTLSHTQLFISSRVAVRCLSGRLATRTNSGL
jgi:hypothetical protein